MALLVPTVGENKLLEFQLGVSVPGNQTLKLFVNNITPADADVAGTYTEMSTNGYSAKTLTKTSWVVAQNGAAKAEGTYAQQTFAFTAAAAVTVYGYFVVDSTSGVLLYAERFASPPSISLSTDVIKVTPKFTYSKE